MNGSTADTAEAPRLRRGLSAATHTAVLVRLIADHGQWYADAADFQIVGIGNTRDEAIDTMRRLLRAHIRTAARREVDPRRPESAWSSVKLRAEAILNLPLPRDRRAVRRVKI